MTSHTTHPLPSLSQLIKATAAALIVAGAILITTVLPAEHGIDPTGIGKALGLAKLSTNISETASTLLTTASAATLPRESLNKSAAL